MVGALGHVPKKGVPLTKPYFCACFLAVPKCSSTRNFAVVNPHWMCEFPWKLISRTHENLLRSLLYEHHSVQYILSSPLIFVWHNEWHSH